MSDFTPADLEKEREMWRKAIADAVAQEAARWREAVEEIAETGCGLSHEGACCLSESGVIHDLRNLLKEDGKIWLARHDAEVLRPWREAVESAIVYTNVEKRPDTRLALIRDTLRALLSPASALKEEKA